ncbi:MAG TPA: TonB family protein [Drouetiella sp.]
MLPESSNESNRKNQQDLIDTLGNPHASESDWMKANEGLGSNFKPKPNSDEIKAQRKKNLAELGLLGALGMGIVGMFMFVHPSNNMPSDPAPQPPAPHAAHAPAATADVDFGPFMADLQRSIKHNWHPPKGDESRRVVVTFKISKEGFISNLRLSKSSNIKAADDAALKAVSDTGPEITGLPEGAPSSVDIEFTFDYNVFNKNSKHS